MGGKKSFKLRFDAPVILSLCIISFLVPAANRFIFKNTDIVQKIFSLPGNLTGADAFNFQKPFDYARLFLYVFGNTGFLQFLSAFAFILPLGVQMEERYGSAALFVMILITVLVNGVLNACLIPATICGAWSVVFMLILLSSITALAKKEFPLSAAAILAVFIGMEIALAETAPERTMIISILAQLAGGLCGSMFGFLTAPKARRASSKPAQSPSAYNGYEELEEVPKKKPSFWERKKQERLQKKFDEDTTVVGSINI